MYGDISCLGAAGAKAGRGTGRSRRGGDGAREGTHDMAGGRGNEGVTELPLCVNHVTVTPCNEPIHCNGITVHLH